MISAERPRPVGGYTETILRMIDVIFCAVAQAAPERAPAQAYGTINALSIAGYRSDAARKGSAGSCSASSAAATAAIARATA